jgi:hypothetical protein
MLSERASSGPRLLFWGALALVPLLYLVVDLAFFSIDIPLWDSWEFVPLLKKQVEGSITWQDLWNLHNQHRLLFPKATLLLLARPSSWSTAWEKMFQVLQAVACLGVLVRCGVSFLEETTKERPYELAAFLSVLVFSQTQWENWICGWQIQIWMSTAASTVGLLILGRAPYTAARRLWALALGVLATYSFGTGILFWPVGAFVLVFAKIPERRLAPRLIVWFGAAAFVLGAYAHGYHETPDAIAGLGRGWDSGRSRPTCSVSSERPS